MKPDIKLLLEQAKQPRPHYVPARAGWNGPEEKAPDSLRNATYDQLRREASPVERKQELVAAAIPDWRIVLMLVGMILMFRATIQLRLLPSSSDFPFRKRISAKRQMRQKPHSSRNSRFLQPNKFLKW